MTQTYSKVMFLSC